MNMMIDENRKDELAMRFINAVEKTDIMLTKLAARYQWNYSSMVSHIKKSQWLTEELKLAKEARAWRYAGRARKELENVKRSILYNTATGKLYSDMYDNKHNIKDGRIGVAEMSGSDTAVANKPGTWKDSIAMFSRAKAVSDWWLKMAGFLAPHIFGDFSREIKGLQKEVLEMRKVFTKHMDDRKGSDIARLQ